ncbi:hypothetical protein Acsp01_28230 [Actinoplanes sp. NBRC 101535]|nr:hypothetical protein Acsp01_28230 [Actinoplanes sp. NBRC 101535]
MPPSWLPMFASSFRIVASLSPASKMPPRRLGRKASDSDSDSDSDSNGGSTTGRGASVNTARVIFARNAVKVSPSLNTSELSRFTVSDLGVAEYLTPTVADSRPAAAAMERCRFPDPLTTPIIGTTGAMASSPAGTIVGVEEGTRRVCRFASKG